MLSYSDIRDVIVGLSKLRVFNKKSQTDQRYVVEVTLMALYRWVELGALRSRIIVI